MLLAVQGTTVHPLKARLVLVKPQPKNIPRVAWDQSHMAKKSFSFYYSSLALFLIFYQDDDDDDGDD